MARKERTPRRPSFEEQARQIAELEGKLRPLQAFWAWQRNPRAHSCNYSFSVPPVDSSGYTVDVYVTLWIGPRRAGMVVCEARIVPRDEAYEPIWIEPIFAYDLAKQWEASGDPYYQHAATKLRALEASMYEQPANTSEGATSEG